MFRRFAIASTILVSATILVAPAWADTLDVDGDVASISSVTTTGAGNYNNLALGGVGAGSALTNQVEQVATIAVYSNNNEGVNITATDGSLTHDGTSPDTIPYDVKLVLGAAAAPASGDFADGGSNLNVDVDDASGVGAAKLYVMYSTPNALEPGNYSDTITIAVDHDL